MIPTSIEFVLQTSHKCFIPRVLLISFISATATNPGWNSIKQIMELFKVCYFPPSRPLLFRAVWLGRSLPHKSKRCHFEMSFNSDARDFITRPS